MIWKIAKKIKARALWRLIILCVKHPIYVIPTMRASKKCIAICNKIYKNTHHLNNKANAFRHALWNILITQKCAEKNTNFTRALAWTKLITDWHETFSVNAPLARAMDMHNNAIGRMMVRTHNNENEQNLIKITENALKNAKKVTKIEDLDQYIDQLVYLEE